MSWGVGLLVLGVALLLFTFFAVPVLVQVKRTARKVEITLGHVNRDLPAILDNLHHTTDNFRRTTETVHGVSADVRSLGEELRGVGGQISSLDRRLRDGIGAPSPVAFGIMKKPALIAFVIIRILRFLRGRRRRRRR
ncbi:MAG TPA: DUF948 domain-containing protein [Syntrophales bacterium]|nr:DUF948 domain-containing protein [Syntrophales bacterium]HOX93604.1 DUF948 domain-containing protein [Syntrophales bacterium]HPI56899.1 DUF948 domain-containing protein [Syntrophales bacterium]HPN23485.1 DUF948 domain-containing protein [Syntrophales bacterium]HQM27990.1 DUF948 domain-containing protein [Syntrophales bacterium]